MGRAAKDRNASSNARPNQGEMRASPRFTLLIRSAKLVCGTREYLCVVRDVSETGTRLRLFHPIPPNERLSLEISSGDSFVVDPVWERADHAGFRFAHAIDIERFVAETGPFPKRPVRLCFDHPVTISTYGMHGLANVRDLSRAGACIETEMPLVTGQNLTISAKGLPEKIATVRWRDGRRHGVVFQQSLTIECLALVAHRLQAHALAVHGERGQIGSIAPDLRPGGARPYCHSCNNSCPLLMLADSRPAQRFA